MKKVAVIRGKFLNQYEMQSYAPLAGRVDLTAFGSLNPFQDRYPFPVVKLPSPMDLPDFPLKMPLLNRLFIDAHYLFGLEEKLIGFDIAHSAETYYCYTQQALNARDRGWVKKVIATVLENIPHNNEGIWGRKAFKKRSREELDHIIALTEATKLALVEEGADPRKITVIGHGIDTRRFFPDPSQQHRISADHDDVRLFYAGRLEWYKGVCDILDAFLLLRREYPKLKLTFVGNGSAKDELVRKAASEGVDRDVEFLSGGYDVMDTLYRRADILVAPSISIPTYREQYCTVLLEAQAMGLPIVTTRSGGIPENVGDCALFAREHDPEDLALQMRKFIGDSGLRRNYAKKARLRSEKVHDARIIADKIYSVYEHVLSSDN